MSDHTPPPPKPPVYKSYEERKAAQDKLRAENNRRTHQSYRLPPIPPPSQTKSSTPSRPQLPDTGGVPTRDMPPVKLPLAHKREGEFADVIPLGRKKQENPK